MLCFIYVKGRVAEERAVSSICCFALKWPGLGQAETRLNLAHYWQGPSTWAIFAAFPGTLAGGWVESGAARTRTGAWMGSQHCTEQLNLQLCSAGPSRGHFLKIGWCPVRLLCSKLIFKVNVLNDQDNNPQKNSWHRKFLMQTSDQWSCIFNPLIHFFIYVICKTSGKSEWMIQYSEKEYILKHSMEYEKSRWKGVHLCPQIFLLTKDQF